MQFTNSSFTLTEVFDHIIYGAMSNHSIGTNLVDGYIDPKHYKKIGTLINAALKIFYTKYMLRMNSVHVDLYENIQRYELSSKYAFTQASNPKYTDYTKYISDSFVDPFTDDVVKIVSISDELGRDKWLNDPNQYWSINVLDYKTFLHPYTDNENTVEVHYQALHPKIIIPDDLTDFDPNDVELAMPEGLMEALVNFIGSKIHVDLHQEARMAEAQHWHGLYKQAMAEFNNSMPDISRVYSDDSIERGGYV